MGEPAMKSTMKKTDPTMAALKQRLTQIIADEARALVDAGAPPELAVEECVHQLMRLALDMLSDVDFTHLKTPDNDVGFASETELLEEAQGALAGLLAECARMRG